MSSFSTLGLPETLLRATAECGYTTPTPIQAAAIPAVLTGNDLLACAQTGTGKTAAFLLPIIARLLANPAPKHAIRALVLAPTRELAAQIEAAFRDYARGSNLRGFVVFGGVNIRPQMAQLARGVDVLIATPGRLLDIAGQGGLNLKGVECFVLDEADRMLDMGFIRDIKRVIALMPQKRQNLMFSATFPPEIMSLASSLLRSPVKIEVARNGTSPTQIEQKVCVVDKTLKKDALLKLIQDGKWFQVLVFTRTKHGANRLSEQLDKAGVPSLAIHGNKSQNARTRALASFKAGELQVLVATDIAARGIDIDELPFVVNYELPQVPEDYVHRIGRTGRAGAGGQAFSLVGSDELSQLAAIERLLGKRLERFDLPGLKAAPAAPASPQRQSHEPRRAPQEAGAGRFARAPRGTQSGNRRSATRPR